MLSGSFTLAPFTIYLYEDWNRIWFDTRLIKSFMKTAKIEIDRKYSSDWHEKKVFLARRPRKKLEPWRQFNGCYHSFQFQISFDLWAWRQRERRKEKYVCLLISAIGSYGWAVKDIFGQRVRRLNVNWGVGRNRYWGRGFEIRVGANGSSEKVDAKRVELWVNSRQFSDISWRSNGVVVWDDCFWWL
jgi:hypothetical protein